MEPLSTSLRSDLGIYRRMDPVRILLVLPVQCAASTHDKPTVAFVTWIKRQLVCNTGSHCMAISPLTFIEKAHTLVGFQT